MNRAIVVAATLMLALVAVSTDARPAPAERNTRHHKTGRANLLFDHPVSPFRMMRRGGVMPDGAGAADKQACDREPSRVKRAKCETKPDPNPEPNRDQTNKQQKRD